MTEQTTQTDAYAPELSIVIPARNEQDNVATLVAEIDKHIVQQGIAAELIVINDGSTDDTLGRLQAEQEKFNWLVILHREIGQGQSAAMGAGIAHARAPLIATLDADLQNDPADLPQMMQLLQEQQADMVQGDRSQARKDSWIRRYGSIVGRLARRWVLNDPVRDTGCSARVMRTCYAKQIPLQYRGMHRFFPAFVHMLGGKVIEMPAHHRPRTAGETKYGMGILTRGPAGIFDLLAVRWMRSRLQDVSVTVIRK